MSLLEQSIYNTIRYFDVLDMPVTATQVWQTLLLERTSHKRWGGYKHWSLPEVAASLAQPSLMAGRVQSKWGYYFLAGREDLVKRRLHRHRLSQQKWKIAKRAARFLAIVPGVRALAGSGSLACDNTHSASDLDFLVITSPKRIWTTRLLLLAMSQLLGRRRKHWDKQAPDMLCLNHYVSQSHMRLPAELHNTYTAVQYSGLVPVFGQAIIKSFQKANAPWILQEVMVFPTPSLAHLYTIRLPAVIWAGKRFVESLLLEPAGEFFEGWAEKIQRRLIMRHHGNRGGRVIMSASELAFHPDTKVPAVLARYHQDPGQKTLL